MTLNKIAEQSYRNAVKRRQNGANIDTSTIPMLKHTATEVVEATQAFVDFLYFIRTDSAFDYKEKFAGELADIICCVAIVAEANNIDLDKAVADCLKKNRKRAEGTGDKL